jgi:signal peptidase II
MTGGALGNLIDRCADGRVTDFLDLHPAEVHWFTFNMADIWISLGAALIAWEAVGKPGRPRPPAPLDPAALRAP